MEKKISVTLVVYNEESRLEILLKCLAAWCDDIVVVDKSSTDRTREIALQYTPKVFVVPYSDAGIEGRYAADQTRHEWVWCFTASDIVPPGLVTEVQRLINRDPFPYDVIMVPFVVKIFGIYNKHSPWRRRAKPHVFRKDVYIPRNEIHRDLTFSSKRIFNMPYSDTVAVFHLTHPTLDIFYKRMIQYCHMEPDKYPTRFKGLATAFSEIILGTGWLIIRKRVFMLGWDGLALGIAFISYYMAKFLFIWEKYRPAVNYAELQQSIINEWQAHRSRTIT